jgi:predicted DsbA family dithiol-disulfide isomerase
MPYTSTITFTLDIICPWTYLGFLRLTRALSDYRTSNPDSPVTFVLQIAPYQLYADFSADGVDKYKWYRDEKYGGSEQKMGVYSDYMKELGEAEGIEFDFGKAGEGGKIANTLHAHRIIQYLQAETSPAHALAALTSLYSQYFTQRAHPSSPSTLITACLAAGLSQKEAEELVADESVYLMETKAAVREQAGNGVDSVPYVVFEGRKRDFTEVGAKSGGEYGKVLGQIVREAS